MSYITDVALFCSSEVEMRPVNDWLVNVKGHITGLKRINPRSVGGDKTMLVKMFVGTFNYLNVGEFVDMLRELPWVDDYVFVLISQEISTFTMYAIRGEMQHYDADVTCVS